jgi:putative ABC transport system ATP-binding protein
MMGEAPVLSLRGVGKRFPTAKGERRVLEGIDFDCSSGDFAVVTGPSGSGKTTLLNLAALLATPSEGTLSFDGQSIGPGDDALARAIRREKIGMIFQQFHLLPHRSVLENILFRFRYLKSPPADQEARAMEVIRDLGLEEVQHQQTRLLSGGEMQRVAIARALVHPPRLVVADEPTGNLDRDTAKAVMTALQQLHQKGIAVLLVTHNLELLSYGNRHLVCDNAGLHEEVLV